MARDPLSALRFSGFKGVATALDLSGVRFVLLAGTLEELQHLCDMTGQPFDPARCLNVILVSPDLLFPVEQNATDYDDPTQENRS
jgi:hypothetical protein